MVDHYRKLLQPNGVSVVEKLEDCIGDDDIFTIDDIIIGIGQLKNNKALGTCHINAEVLKGLVCNDFAMLIVFLFNCIVRCGMPSSFNILTITSLHKKGSIDDPNNFRGLSVMHVFAKLFATCLNNLVT